MEKILLTVVSVLGIVLLLRMMSAPIRLVYKLALNTLCGFALLVLFNLLGGAVGMALGLNLMTVLTVGLLGLPGLGLLLVCRVLLL